MKHIICAFSLVALAIQVCKAQSPSPTSKGEQNFEWLAGHPEKDEIMKNYKAWMSCKNSKRPQTECDALYDILVKPAPAVIEKLHQYGNLVKTAPKNEEKKINEMKIQLYPWTDIFDLCIHSFPQSYCDDYIKYLHLPENRMRQPDDLKLMMWQQICVAAGKSAEDCAKEAAAAAVKVEKDVKSKGNGNGGEL